MQVDREAPHRDLGGGHFGRHYIPPHQGLHLQNHRGHHYQ